jgi:hypothetical protein
MNASLKSWVKLLTPEKKNFLDGERKSSEDEERNLYCVCGELKTACPDGYAHTTGGA